MLKFNVGAPTVGLGNEQPAHPGVDRCEQCRARFRRVGVERRDEQLGRRPIRRFVPQCIPNSDAVDILPFAIAFATACMCAASGGAEHNLRSDASDLRLCSTARDQTRRDRPYAAEQWGWLLRGPHTTERPPAIRGRPNRRVGHLRVAPLDRGVGRDLKTYGLDLWCGRARYVSAPASFEGVSAVRDRRGRDRPDDGTDADRRGCRFRRCSVREPPFAKRLHGPVSADRCTAAKRLTCANRVGLPGLEPGTFGPPDRRANQAAPQPAVEAPRLSGPGRAAGHSLCAIHSTPWQEAVSEVHGSEPEQQLEVPRRRRRPPRAPAPTARSSSAFRARL